MAIYWNHQLSTKNLTPKSQPWSFRIGIYFALNTIVALLSSIVLGKRE